MPQMHNNSCPRQPPNLSLRGPRAFHQEPRGFRGTMQNQAQFCAFADLARFTRNRGEFREEGTSLSLLCISAGLARNSASRANSAETPRFARNREPAAGFSGRHPRTCRGIPNSARGSRNWSEAGSKLENRGKEPESIILHLQHQFKP